MLKKSADMLFNDMGAYYIVILNMICEHTVSDHLCKQYRVIAGSLSKFLGVFMIF